MAVDWGFVWSSSWFWVTTVRGAEPWKRRSPALATQRTRRHVSWSSSASVQSERGQDHVPCRGWPRRRVAVYWEQRSPNTAGGLASWPPWKPQTQASSGVSWACDGTFFLCRVVRAILLQNASSCRFFFLLARWLWLFGLLSNGLLCLSHRLAPLLLCAAGNADSCALWRQPLGHASCRKIGRACARCQPSTRRRLAADQACCITAAEWAAGIFGLHACHACHARFQSSRHVQRPTTFLFAPSACALSLGNTL